MKKQYVILALVAAMAASCADEFDQNFEVGRPSNLEQYAYLSEYKPLKEYVDFAANPNFKLGLGVDAADYVKQGVPYVVANTNFNEVVAGNAMKMGSCVDNNGNMTFGDVNEFAKAAKAANMNIYGHTLAWHEQQPVKWLNTLIADRPDPDYTGEPVAVVIKDKRRCIRVNSDDMKEAAWDTQFWLYFPDDPIPSGASYEFSIDLMANKAATAGSQTHKDPGGYIHWSGVGTLPFTEEWTTFTSSGTFMSESTDGYSIAFNLNDFAEANIYYFDNISLKINGKEVIKNGDCEGSDVSSFRTKEMRGATVESTIVDETEVTRYEQQAATKEVDVPRNCILVESGDLVEAAWDTQFWLYFPDDPIAEGDKYEFSADVMAQFKASSGTQTHVEPGAYIHWAGVGTVPFETEWTTFTSSGTFTSECNGGISIAFNLNDFAGANKYYFDNISLKINGKEVIQNGDCEDPTNTASFRTKEQRGQTVPSRIVDHYTTTVSMQPTIPLEPEEKRDTLIMAMEQWIKGILDACRTDDGELMVTAWDAVNEPLAGADLNGDGLFDLQHAPEAGDETKFYWQDYLGDTLYVREVVRLARQYGGGDSIKLFVNDYNLEYDWDASGNKKLENLIKWIAIWEADGKTKLDGIGTQMHISCYADSTEQDKRKQLIENSFRMLAATGKLIRISELDMGMIDEDGNDVLTPDMTEEQHHAMADLYTFVIQKYLEIIPAAQQWGICQWCATDSPAKSAWRPNQPTGLWDEDYYRKHTYAGFANGFSAK
ncbi:MAG: endo-1,4-beta-xylanase [Prevotella sp.]|nr:endo-1,4-beta-xylanase [Prevotella sp.]